MTEQEIFFLETEIKVLEIDIQRKQEKLADAKMRLAIGKAENENNDNTY